MSGKESSLVKVAKSVGTVLAAPVLVASFLFKQAAKFTGLVIKTILSALEPKTLSKAAKELVGAIKKGMGEASDFISTNYDYWFHKPLKDAVLDAPKSLLKNTKDDFEYALTTNEYKDLNKTTLGPNPSPHSPTAEPLQQHSLENQI